MGFPVGFRQILHAGGPVLLLLIGLSIYSIALILQRWVAFRRFTKQVEETGHRLRLAPRSGEMEKSGAQMRSPQDPVAWIFHRVYASRRTREDRRSLSALAIERQLTQLQAGLATLGTIGSISPFIGLFGTVLGVMRAFRDLASYQGAGPGVVALGVSEALVATAAGLFVAIPAIVAYNFFSRKSQQLFDELTWLSEEVID